MDSDLEMNAASDDEVMDDEDYYDYCDSDMGDGGGSDGGSEEEELVAGDYDEGLEAEGTDEVVSRREQVRPMRRARGGYGGAVLRVLSCRRNPWGCVGIG